MGDGGRRVAGPAPIGAATRCSLALLMGQRWHTTCRPPSDGGVSPRRVGVVGRIHTRLPDPWWCLTGSGATRVRRNRRSPCLGGLCQPPLLCCRGHPSGWTRCIGGWGNGWLPRISRTTRVIVVCARMGRCGRVSRMGWAGGVSTPPVPHRSPPTRRIGLSQSPPSRWPLSAPHLARGVGDEPTRAGAALDTAVFGVGVLMS